MKRFRMIAILATVFVSSACAMSLELIGTRLFAPYFGNSIVVWAVLIGIVLAAMSIGNLVGGRLAERLRTEQALFWVLLVEAAIIAAICLFEHPILSVLYRMGSQTLSLFCAALILFLIPCVTFGIVTPFATRILLDDSSDSGLVVGGVPALATVGSIAGTLATGFWLLALFGSHALLSGIALVLLVLSLVFLTPLTLRKTLALGVVAIIVILSFISAPSIPRSFDTRYERYWIEESGDIATNRPTRLLKSRLDSIESAVYTDDGSPVFFPYYTYYDAAIRLAPSPHKTLIIGGGTFSFPRWQLTQYPESTIDVVEIDDRLLEVARSDFYFTDDERLAVWIEDGRTFLNRGARQETDHYEVIILDAFKSSMSVPYQLTTMEAMLRCRELLTSDGMFAMNIIGSLSGQGARYVQAQYLTVRSVFPQVIVSVVDGDADNPQLQNISLIASNNPGDDLASRFVQQNPDLEARLVSLEPTTSVHLLTDDYAPVDHFLNAVGF